jgi:hypothetical protein
MFGEYLSEVRLILHGISPYADEVESFVFFSWLGEHHRTDNWYISSILLLEGL